jgi:2,4-dienoyl-CoA reductase-like NADH-dependent reductase (Old Yellow Enzyme family)
MSRGVVTGTKMPSPVRIGTLKTVDEFRAALTQLNCDIPCDQELLPAPASPLAQSIKVGGLHIANRFAIHPMEGWDGTRDGRPTPDTFRRWSRFGQSGAKLIWGGEAVAVCHDGRANPHQLVIGPTSEADLAQLRQTLLGAHQSAAGSTDGLVIGLQLTHSGRYSKPNDWSRMEPRKAFAHPILDRRLSLAPADGLLSDDDIQRIIDAYVPAAILVEKVGFDFIDIKHCHGYLGHEILGAHTRPGRFGGSFENRTRYLRDIIAGVRAATRRLKIGVRLSAFDWVPFRPDPALSKPGKPGPGTPEPFDDLLPYRWGFGVDEKNPTQYDLAEPIQFLELLRSLDIRLVNLTAGSPYYNPHIQRPALYPPSDGYQPPEDPLIGVARQMKVTRELKQRFPDLLIVGSAFTYLQDFLPNVAQAAVRENWCDSVGLGRMVLAYPQLPSDLFNGRPLMHKKVCRTFSDCTTAPRNALKSGCYPLDDYYKDSPQAVQLRIAKKPHTR